MTVNTTAVSFLSKFIVSSYLIRRLMSARAAFVSAISACEFLIGRKKANYKTRTRVYEINGTEKRVKNVL